MKRLLWIGLAGVALATLPSANGHTASAKNRKDQAPHASPASNPAAWFSDDDYPVEARRANQAGRVAVSIAVDADGKVTGCTVVASSGSASLDEATCRLVRLHGQFTPAKDRHGRAVASTYPLATRWTLANDEDEVEPLATSRSAIIFRIDPVGKIVSCSRTDSQTNPAIAINMCDKMKQSSSDVLTSMRGDTTGPVDVTMEITEVVDGDPAPQMAYDKSDAAVVILTIGMFDVDTAGKVLHCSSSSPVGPPVSICTAPEIANGHSPDGKMRHVTYTVAISRMPAK